jgi:hypothetical protein
VDRYLGALAATVGDGEAADAHFAAAVALEESAGGPALAVRTRLAHARAVAQDPAGDRRRAEALLDAAEASATDLGLPGALAEAQAVRAGAS